MDINFKIVAPSGLRYEEIMQLRIDILFEHLHIDNVDEIDGDGKVIHVAGFRDDKVCACARLVDQGGLLKIQRVVVEARLQNKGVGTQMMSFCENYALNNDYVGIYVYARDTAVKYYLKNGYRVIGDYFEEDNIPHLKMIKYFNKTDAFDPDLRSLI